ncbi:hypothetical protein M103_3136 [Bacteroides fragilis str. 1007-1-F |jgi:hypothetical protein|nr:hypothetical protein M103_3136 [Bacteroides fragilis str. 1007-1-F \
MIIRAQIIRLEDSIMKLEKYYGTKTAGLEGQPNKKKNKRMADIVAVNVKYVLFG